MLKLAVIDTSKAKWLLFDARSVMDQPHTSTNWVKLEGRGSATAGMGAGCDVG